MKRMCTGIALALAALIAVGAAPSASAQDAGGGYKIGVVDVKAVMRDYNKRQQKYAQLESEVNSRQGKIDSLSNEIEAEKKRYNTMREGGTASPEEINNLESQIQRKYTEYKAQMEILQQEIDNLEADVLREVSSDVENAINAIGTSENYHIILNATRGTGGVVYYAKPVDLTPRVVAQLNGGASPAAAAAPAAAPAEDGKKKKRD